MPDRPYVILDGEKRGTHIIHIDVTQFPNTPTSAVDNIPGAIFITLDPRSSKGRLVLQVEQDPLYDHPIDEMYNYMDKLVNEENDKRASQETA